MEIYNITDSIDFPDSVIALGNFDGVHIAHKQVIKNCKKLAETMNIKSSVMLFKTPVKDAEIISTLQERIELIDKIGVDFIILCNFDEKFKKQSPEEFILFLKDKLNAKAVSAGFDYRFGYKASGNADTLRTLAEKHNLAVSICEEQKKDGISVSSTIIREYITSGKTEKAKDFLGHSFYISGEVAHGFQNGRKIGFATANIKPEPNRILPPDGVYGGYTLFDGVRRPSIINIGTNPTFNGKERTVESHIIDFDSDIYGKQIKLEFEFFIRGENKFSSIDELKEQISKDREFAKTKLKDHINQ